MSVSYKHINIHTCDDMTLIFGVSVLLRRWRTDYSVSDNAIKTCRLPSSSAWRHGRSTSLCRRPTWRQNLAWRNCRLAAVDLLKHRPISDDVISGPITDFRPIVPAPGYRVSSGEVVAPAFGSESVHNGAKGDQRGGVVGGVDCSEETATGVCRRGRWCPIRHVGGRRAYELLQRHLSHVRITSNSQHHDHSSSKTESQLTGV